MHEPSLEHVRDILASGLPLAVMCGYCARRALIRPERLSRLEPGTYVSALPLICRCRSRDVKVFVFETPDEVLPFIEPNSAPGGPGLGRTGLWRPIFWDAAR